MANGKPNLLEALSVLMGIFFMAWLGWFTWWVGEQTTNLRMEYRKLDMTQDRLYLRQTELCDAVQVLIAHDVCELRDEL